MVESARSRGGRARAGLSAALLLTSLTSACGDAPKAEDRAALAGLWEPLDGSGKTVDFKEDGLFHYYYVAGSNILELKWKLLHPGEVQLSTIVDDGKRSCFYTVTDNELHIDNGRGETCVKPGVTPPEPMPMDFRRAN